MKGHDDVRVRRNGLNAFLREYPKERVVEFAALNNMDVARQVFLQYVNRAKD